MCDQLGLTFFFVQPQFFTTDAAGIGKTRHSVISAFLLERIKGKGSGYLQTPMVPGCVGQTSSACWMKVLYGSTF